MPAPAVYVLAVVGTVGAVLAFKEFVYEPHIAPTIDRWKAEYQAARAARRRRQATEIRQDQSDLKMSETQRKSKGRSNDKYSDDDDSDDDDNQDHGKKATTTSHSFMRDGLLVRRPLLVTKDQPDVEMDNLVAHEVNEWRNEATGQVLRQRKNVSEYAMDESVQPIPYVPLSPSRTHVVFDSSASSPSTPSTHSRFPSPPPQQIQPPNTLTGKVIFTGLPISPAPTNLSSPVDVPQESVDLGERSAPVSRSASSTPSLLISPQMHETSQPISETSSISSPPPEVTPFHHMVAQSTLLERTAEIPPTFNIYVPAHPLQHSYPQMVPSLSQSYPQDLDYEHDLELLSPPSSRSESPFSMAALSPNEGLRALSPFGARSASGFSSGVSSPSPLRMDLGNQSYDAISPIPQNQSISPFLDPPRDTSTATPSTQSTIYLSLADESSDGDSDFDPQPYAHFGRSTGLEGTFGPVATQAQAQSQLSYHQPAVLHPSPYSTPRDTSRLAARPVPSASHTPSARRTGAGQIQTPTPDAPGLGLFPIPARDPRTPPAPAFPPASRTANAAVAVGAGAGDPAYFRASSTPASESEAPSASFRTASEGPGQSAVPSDSESSLSDVDFVSDYAPSESDLGDESDASWGMPAARAPPPGAGRGAAATVREAQGGRLWRA